MSTFIDLTGTRYANLLVISRAPNYEKFSISHNRVLKYARWNCLCDCGEECIVLATDLKSKSQVSCGCVNNKLRRERKTTHGKSRSKEHRAWKSAKSRCYNPNIERYELYGGRGITMQKDWVEDFSKFYDYIGKCPSPQHSLDRIDSNGNYEEGNVRWATSSEQTHNTRRKKSNNKYKYVIYKPLLKKYFTTFTFKGINYSCGYFKDEKEAAISIYKLYEQIVGYYPKYIEEDLIKLNLKFKEEENEN